MTYDLHFLPEVEEDAIAGYSWYEEKARELGDDFLRMFYACVNDITRNPFLYQKVYRGVPATSSQEISVCDLLQNRTERNPCCWTPPLCP